MKAHECPATKKCSQCGKRKPHSEFYETRKTNKCKECEAAASHRRYLRAREKRLAQCAEYRKENGGRIKRYLAEWYKSNRDHVLTRCKEYNSRPEVKARERDRQAVRYAGNRDAIQAARKARYLSDPIARNNFEQYQRRYYRENRPKFVARGGKRRAAKGRAVPKWADLKAIAKLYRRAAEMTLATGIKHVVDHIVPLQGRTVCGLHVENNLQVIPEKVNLQKFNKHG